MSESTSEIGVKQASTVPSTAPAEIPLLPGWVAASPVAERRRVLRLIREGYQRVLQGSGITPVERHAAALRVAVLNEDRRLAAYHRRLLRRLGTGEALIAAVGQPELPRFPQQRLFDILQHADLVTTGTPSVLLDHVATMQANGFAAAEIAALTRLVAFANFRSLILADLEIREEPS